MRRRKATRGRPRKVKKGRFGKLQNSVPFDSKLSGDTLDDQTTNLKSDDAVTSGFIGLDKTGPYSYRVGSVNIELEGADEDIKPVIQENDIMLEVECGSNTASMFLSRLCQGSKGSCIEFDGAWLTPNEFQFVSGRETAKDWKRSIRHFGRSLKLLITKGILTVHPAACRCDSCRLLSSTTSEPKLILEKIDRELREKKKGGSEGSASGSDKDEGDGRSDEDEAEDGIEEGGDDSQDEAENGDEDSGSEEGYEDVDEEGKVEENNNEAGDKESSSSSDGSSSSGSSSSSDSDSDEDERKDEEEEEEEENIAEVKPDVPTQVESVFEQQVSASAAEAAAAAVVTSNTAEAHDQEEEENMEVDEEGEKVNEEEDEVGSIQAEDENIDEEPHEDVMAEDPATENEPPMESSEEMSVEKDTENKVTNEEETNPVEDLFDKQSSPEISYTPSQSPEPSETIKSEEHEEECDNPNESESEQVAQSPEQMKSEDVCEDSAPAPELVDIQDDLMEPLDLPKDETSLDSSSNAPSVDSTGTNASKREQSPVPPTASTPTMADNPVKKTVERSNSGGGKSRLSNIIDLLRTSKEKETQKQIVPDRSEEKRQERQPPEVKDVKAPSPLPPRREEVKPRKPEREDTKPTRDEIKINEKAREAMRYPMGRLPFGFPPPDLLERASREAHEQLSKSHRQFEKNLESLIAQNMNPFIPELSIFSVPEHRAQMEYNYLKNMERLDQMAKERMATMAELRHQQLIREHNNFVAKLAEHQQKNLRQEPERPREPAKKPAAVPPKQRKEDQPQSQNKAVPHAHRAMPEVRKDKPDQRTLQTPLAAHQHQPTSRPPSTGSKPPSSLPLPASTARAAHPTGPSATHSRSSPMIAPIAPPLQMWSSCFPYVIPPPTMEMQRLTQFFPNLNGGLFSPESGTKRHTESPILDLSTKKRKMQMDSRDHESRSKEPRMSSSSKSVHSPNGLPRETLHHRSHSNKDSSAKERSVWPGFDRNSALTCTCALQHLNDIRTWSVDDVCCFLKGLEGCTLYVDAFRRNGVDGNTLLLLTAETLMTSIGMKPGAAHFLTESVSKRARDLQKLVPCEYCRMKIQKG